MQAIESSNRFHDTNQDRSSSSDSELSLEYGNNHESFRNENDDVENSETLRKVLSRTETSRVDRLRWIVIAILMFISGAISFVVYSVSNYAEEQEFIAQYDGAASKILSSFDRFVERLGIVNSIGVTATTYGLGQNSNDFFIKNSTINNASSLWPFVTVPNFAQRAASARELSKMWLVSIYPKINDDTRDEWERYVVQDSNKYWINEGINYLDQAGLGQFEQYQSIGSKQLSILEEMENITRKSISYFNSADSNIELESGPGPYLAKWQTSPTLKYDVDINFNLLHENMAAKSCLDLGRGVFGKSIVAPPGSITSDNTVSAKMATLRSIANRKQMDHGGASVTNFFIPIFDSFLVSTRKTVGLLLILSNWRVALENVLPIQLRGIHAVVENTCDGNITFIINGPKVDVVGTGDLHQDTRYSVNHRLVEFDSQTAKIQDGTPDGGIYLYDQGCTYRLHLYPSQDFANVYITNVPIYVTLAVAAAFAFTIGMFLLYDRLVEVRQRNILHKAAQSTALVSTLFPKNVRDQLLNFNEADRDLDKNGHYKVPLTNSRGRMKAFLDNSTSVEHNSMDVTSPSISGVLAVSSSSKSNKQQYPKPIADLFQHCTVMFADIAGFTAWSSMRGPEQVFILLQTLFHGFDQAAKRRKVFKVETIGDCYVAVTGLPEPQTNHALIMARFAMDCKHIMAERVIELQCTLGPDCSDLRMRIGLHSGPVTAGVLVGDRARFQLFGDTVNTAARMESTGIPNKIHISEATADIIIASNKGHWIERREDLVEAKGKGPMQTYWINPDKPKRADTTSSSTSKSNDTASDSGNRIMAVDSKDESILNKKAGNLGGIPESMKYSGLVGWFVEILLVYIERVKRKNISSSNETVPQHSVRRSVGYTPLPGSIALDEVKDFIEIVPPEALHHAASTVRTEHSDNKAFVSEELVSDLRDFVSIVASLHGKNAFHNFEHAAHVTMSAQKLLNGIITPDLSVLRVDNIHCEDDGWHRKHIDDTLRMYHISKSLSDDPIAQLAIVFAAMVHDIDHRGCSNNQLMKEEVQMAARYRNQSLAAQNALDIAWSLLMTKQFDRLRNTIFANQDDLLRFRQILVNAVLATDILNKEMNELRHVRWERVFSSSSSTKLSLTASSRSYLSTRVSEKTKELECRFAVCDELEQLNRKVTIMIEYILQASVISPAMQHWHVYLKWNRLLFHEMYEAFKSGRFGENINDPSTFWYKGELDFFDRSVIPLAQKLKECQVFGAYGDEYLTSAVANRNEWKEKGELIVNDLFNEFFNDIGEF